MSTSASAKEGLVQLAYTSIAEEGTDEATLSSLLTESRILNEKHGVTAVLAYRSGRFMQILEGPVEAVEKTYRRIERDTRHNGVVRTFYEETDTRDFECPLGFAYVPDLCELDQTFLDGVNYPRPHIYNQVFEDLSLSVQLLKTFLTNKNAVPSENYGPR